MSDWQYVSYQGTSCGEGSIHRGFFGAPITLRADLALEYSHTTRITVEGEVLENVDTPICGRFSNVFYRSHFFAPSGMTTVLDDVNYRRIQRVQACATNWTGGPLADPFPWPLLAMEGSSFNPILCYWRTWKEVDGSTRPDHDGSDDYFELLSYLETQEPWMEAVPFYKSDPGYLNVAFWMDVDWKKATGSDEPPGEGIDYGFSLDQDFGVHLVADRAYDP